jgi:transcriptional regulator with GAF, ATPase, and Fis domain
MTRLASPTPEASSTTRSRFPMRNALDASAIRQALDASQGRVVVAARMLGLKNRWVLYRLMEKLDIRA